MKCRQYSTFIFLFVLLFHLHVGAQDQKTFLVKSGMSISEVLTQQDIFRYPKFVHGVVMLKNGRPAQGDLNYNYLIREMQFLNSKGDTISLAQEDQINYIAIAADTFYFNKGYLEKVAGTPQITLVKRTYFKDLHKKIGGYGQPSATSSITSISSIAVNEKSYDLKVSEEIELIKYSDYFFMNKQGELLPADKKNLLKISGQKDKVNEYLKNHNVQFYNEDELVKLINFLKE